MDGRTNCVAAGHNRSHYNFIDRLTVKAAIGPVFKLAVNSEGLMDRVGFFPEVDLLSTELNSGEHWALLGTTPRVHCLIPH